MTYIEKIINDCKKDLDNFFCNFPFIVWKEEDLQSYYYYLLLKEDYSLCTRIHREYPIIIKLEPLKRAGVLDIAILGKFKGDINIENVKIDYAIEMKFMRDFRTGKSQKSLVKFFSECIKDHDKLLSNALNFHDKTKKYFWAFRYIDEPQINEVNKLMNDIKWNDVIWQYTELCSDGSKCKTICR